MGVALRGEEMKSIGAGKVGAPSLPGTRPSVAVIGAGAAGLAAGRILRDEGLRVTIFEKSPDVGGVWRYKPEPEARAPMYRSLVTNLPKEAMSFMGFPFPSELPSFTTHGQVLDYLCSYAEQHELLPLIRFGCAVDSVRPIPNQVTAAAAADSRTHPSPRAGFDGDEVSSSEGEGADEAATAAAPAIVHEPREDAAGDDDDADHFDDSGRGLSTERRGAVGKWEVVYRQGGKAAGGGATEAAGEGAVPPTPASTSASGTLTFDAVCVCNGHFSEPFVPAVEGFDGFAGTSMHSLGYDRPEVEAFVGRRVLCVGSRSSGTDIAREVSSVASVVHVCDRAASYSLRGGERGNVWRRPALERFEGTNGVRFKDGTLAEVDTIVWCTGYKYSFPFFEGSGLLTPPVADRVHPLYEQLFHVRHPSLTFLGLPQSVVPFPLFEVQANAIAAAITGRTSLPSLAEREQWLVEDEEKALQERAVDPSSRGVHVLAARQWGYFKRLLRLAGPGLVARSPDDPRRKLGGVTGDGSVEEEEEEEEEVKELFRSLDLKEAIYNDSSSSRSSFPGAPDEYRRRMYAVDPEAGSFSVSMADRKANGEGPSEATAVAVSASGVSNGTSAVRPY